MKKSYLNYIIYVLMLLTIVLLVYFAFFSNKVKIDGISLNKDRIELFVGDSEKLIANIIPEDIPNVELEWISDNPGVASVNSGLVVANSEGIARVTVSIKDKDQKDTCEVIVIPVATPTPTPEPTPEPTPPPVNVSDITIDKTSIIMANGAKDKLSVTIMPEEADNKEYTWSSSDESIATITDGIIEAKGVGTTKIKAVTVDGNKEASCEIKVVEKKTFDQRSDAIIEYFKEPSTSQIISVYKKFNCKKSSCIKPKKYNPSFSGNINVYEYNISDNTKKLITTVNSSLLDYYLVPEKTYYLESAVDNNNVEIVSITGKLRIPDVNNLSNLRDLGGWNADGGTINYGILFRSARPDKIGTLTYINALGIKKVVDLRKKSEISQYGSNSPVKDIRINISTYNYNIDKSSHMREAVEEIMRLVVSNLPVLFHCQIGCDRTGTVAYLLEGILGVSGIERDMDYELSYLTFGNRTRTYSSYKNLIKSVESYKKNQYDQEKFINWFLSRSTNKEQDLNLINSFRKVMINGNPHTYKLVNDVLTLES